MLSPSLLLAQSSPLGDWTEDRLQAISFFLAALLLAGLAVRMLWNRLAAASPQWPKISYGKSLATVGALGLFSLVVLTMIATTRELMMPGSWQKVGLLYRLPPGLNPAAKPEAGLGPAVNEHRASTGANVARVVLLGWSSFLRDRLSRARSEPTTILYGLGITALFVALLDALARWFCVALTAADGPPRRWRFRWSLAVLAAFVLMFAVIYCTIGLTRQTAWLLSG